MVRVLHSSLCSSPGGETGFDRVATGFCSAVPCLTQALKEDLQVLSSLTEPHTILSFLNVAYFGTVAQEMALEMEREFETVQRDNTVLSSKIKKYSARSRATVGKSLCKKSDKVHFLSLAYFLYCSDHHSLCSLLCSFSSCFLFIPTPHPPPPKKKNPFIFIYLVIPLRCICFLYCLLSFCQAFLFVKK